MSSNPNVAGATAENLVAPVETIRAALRRHEAEAAKLRQVLRLANRLAKRREQEAPPKKTG